MTRWVVRSVYPSGFAEERGEAGSYPQTRAEMLASTSCGTTESTFAAAVAADSEDDARAEALPLIRWHAAYFGVQGEPAETDAWTIAADLEPVVAANLSSP